MHPLLQLVRIPKICNKIYLIQKVSKRKTTITTKVTKNCQIPEMTPAFKALIIYKILLSLELAHMQIIT